MFTDDDIIHSYTRRQAIADGVLLDVTDQAKEAGVTLPVAFTATAWHQFVIRGVEILEVDYAKHLRDVFETIQIAVEKNFSGRPCFRCFVDTSEPRNAARFHLVFFRMITGPDDDWNPCVTVMMPEED